ncbi:MAG: four helix bundle protein [Bacteroidota bacterium]
MPVRSYRDLNVFKVAFQASIEIASLAQSWPADERFKLTDQIIRSSRAVCSNLAEAWKKRPYVKHFEAKLTDAEMEASETGLWLEYAREHNYLHATTYDALTRQYAHIEAMLTKMRRNARTWCGQPKK